MFYVVFSRSVKAPKTSVTSRNVHGDLVEIDLDKFLVSLNDLDDGRGCPRFNGATLFESVATHAEMRLAHQIMMDAVRGQVSDCYHLPASVDVRFTKDPDQKFFFPGDWTSYNKQRAVS